MYLSMELQNPPVVCIRDSDCEGAFRIGDRTFRELSTSNRQGFFLGFYDWLRTADGQSFGVRVTFHDDREDVIAAIRRTSVGSWLAPSIYELRFDSGSIVDESNSVDQEFGVSRAFVDDLGAVVLLFDASEIVSDCQSGRYSAQR
jgi:hypothetical protein